MLVMVLSFSVLSSVLSLFFLFSMLLKALFAIFLSPEDIPIDGGAEVVSAVYPGVTDWETNTRNQSLFQG